MFESLNMVSAELGISIWLLALIMLWSMAWKLAALWKSARRGSLIWFIVLFLVNTVGILEILYIFVFSKMNLGKGKQAKPATIAKKSRSKPKKKK